MLRLLREPDQDLDAVSGIDAARRRSLAEASRLVTFDAQGALEAGPAPGLIDIRA